MASPLNWGIIGAGHIAGWLARGLQESTTGSLLAIGSRAQETADRFGDEYDVPRRYNSYDRLLADPDVQAVYIATPHPMHAEWTIKAAEAGKHILVEKPIGMNWFEAMAMIDAARVNDVFLMEAFMYRCHPQMQRLRELIQSGVIGDVNLMQINFCYHSNDTDESRTHSQALGGGGILDVGCYPASLARLIAGAAIGKDFDEPTDVKGFGHIGSAGTDDWAAATLRFPNDILAQITGGVRLNMMEDVQARIFGSEGMLQVPNPWQPSRFDREPARILVKRRDEKETQEILVDAPSMLYTYEVDTVAENIPNRQARAMSWDDSLGNIRVLDRWRQEIGLVYDLEKPQNVLHTISHRPLAVRPGNNMKYGSIRGVEKRVSRLVMGCDSNNTMPDTAIMFDDFFERGGNTFDTSHGYGNPNGATERNLGQWIRDRGIRDQVVVIEKGANPPTAASPEGLTRELLEGLDRLQMDCVDIFMIHRDNIHVPIDEWMDVLNEHLNKGHMKAFGVSNFTIPRIQAGLDYARAKGLQGFCAISNNFSLAQMLDPVWELCVASSDAESRAWFTKTQMPLMPWSSQGRGFFLERASRTNFSNPELTRCWYSEDNFRRKERAEEMAKKKNVLPINIALAYVLNQPFPTFPLIGPKQISETRSSFQALDIELTPEELRWLNLEA